MGDVAGGQTLAERVAAVDEATSAETLRKGPAPATVPEAAPVSPPIRWRFWRSPPDQPGWARPALLVVAALAALSYGWGMNTDTLEVFYAGAVRSMSQNWHNFFFAAFDPWGTVSVDKLPGAFWFQALSVKAFGSHVWAYVLPSAIEGTLTVLVLYRVVRRVGGPIAGLTAAVALAATPVTILLNRGNISDSLLVLLLVLAADATTRAYTTGRAAALVLAGVWVGLAFQAKMLQAWLVLPALYVAYLLAAPAASLVRRVGHIALSLLVVVVVSLSYMTVVTLVPAHDRPYVDGSCDNSVYSQVFLYNGADRLTGNTLDQPGCSRPPIAVASTSTAGAETTSPGRAETTSTGGAETVSVGSGPGKFLSGLFGWDAAWLFLPALVALVGILVARRHENRHDPWRAAALLWGIWLFLTWCFFASSSFLNGYYLAALAPPMAALCGLGLALAWQRREDSRVVPVVLMATVAAGVFYAVYLVPDSAGTKPWLAAVGAIAALGSVAVLARSLRKDQQDWERRWGLVLGAAALLLGAAWASALAVLDELGPFDAPYQNAARIALEQRDWRINLGATPAVASYADGFPTTQSVDTHETSAEASIYVWQTGREFLPAGGFSGQVPSTPLNEYVAYVREGRVVSVTVSVRPLTRNPDMVWTMAHCAPQRYGAPFTPPGRQYRSYICSPADAAG
jgi:4-amino-4-deoxy-L-arabinose transferase-like glycosyltransferase